METLGTHSKGMEKTLSVLDQDYWEDRNRVNLLEAHHEELNHKLYSLIDLGGVYFFYLILNRTFFELNAE